MQVLSNHHPEHTFRRPGLKQDAATLTSKNRQNGNKKLEFVNQKCVGTKNLAAL